MFPVYRLSSLSITQTLPHFIFAAGSKFVLKLKRNISGQNFDTFHVLIERRPSTAPNSPQPPAARSLSSPSTPSSPSKSSAARAPKQPTAVESPKHGPPAALLIPSSEAAPADHQLYATQSPGNWDKKPTGTASSPSVVRAAPDAAIAIAPLQAATASPKPQASLLPPAVSAASPELNSGTYKAINVDNQVAAAAPPAAPPADPSCSPRPLPTANGGETAAAQVSSRVSDGQQSPPPVSCHRKLQLDAEAHEPASAQSPPPPNANIFTATDHFSSHSKPLPTSSASPRPSASQLVALEEAVAAAAAAQERTAVAAWISSQAQATSPADAAAAPRQHELLEQRLEEQRVWGLVNSTILSDLMKSLGSGSIFHH